jgi:hypothetical protein
MRTIAGIAVAVALSVSSTARAQVPAASGFSLGARLGFGIPMGDADGGDAAAAVPSTRLSDIFSGQLPLQIDAMYRIDPHWSLGLYFQYGFAFVASATCPSGVSCTASDIRFGGQVQYRFDSQGFVPWVGLGIGGEWGTITGSSGGVSADIDISGFEFANFQVGGDWLVSPMFRVGPYLQLTLAQYDTYKALGQTISLPDKTMHEWLQIGVKGTFDL